MPPPVNLLPWRQIQRLKALRFWGVMFAALPLLSLVLLLRGHAARVQGQALAEIYSLADAARLQAFAGRERLLRESLEQQESQQLRLQQRVWTGCWQAGLTALAQALPEDAWLTALRWQGSTLELHGLTARVVTLSALEDALKALPGYRTITAGPVRRDTEGRWAFNYRLEEAPREPGAD